MSRLWRRTEHLARWLESLATEIPNAPRTLQDQARFSATAVRGTCDLAQADPELVDEELSEKLFDALLFDPDEPEPRDDEEE